MMERSSGQFSMEIKEMVWLWRKICARERSVIAVSNGDKEKIGLLATLTEDVVETKAVGMDFYAGMRKEVQALGVYGGGRSRDGSY